MLSSPLSLGFSSSLVGSVMCGEGVFRKLDLTTLSLLRLYSLLYLSAGWTSSSSLLASGYSNFLGFP